MGWGDEIMAAGRAREAQKTDPRPVAILNRKGRPRWHEAWRNNPRILHPSEVGKRDHQCITDGPGARPYVVTSNRWHWQFVEGRQTRGEIYLTDEEKVHRPAGDYVLLHPHQKPEARNKDWGLHNWQDLVRSLDGVRLVQGGAHKWPALTGVEKFETKTFRDMAAIVAGARLVVTGEGAVHHAAAAFHVPAVVLFGPYLTPEVTGYPEQVAITAPGGPCGRRTPCEECARGWKTITPDRVADEVLRALSDESRGAAA